MKNKKNLILIGILIVVVILSIIVFSTTSKPKNESKNEQTNTNTNDKTEEQEIITEQTPENVKNDIIDKVENSLASTMTTKEKIDDIIGYDIPSSYYVAGEDSYIKKIPSTTTIKKYKLESYVEKQEQYAKRIETEYLDSLKVSFGESQTIDNEIHQQTKFISFYYGMYIGDLTELQNILFTTKGHKDISDIEEGSEIEVDYYKAKVDAMEVLDRHFDTYVNREEEHEVVIIYKDGKPKDKDEAFTLLCNLSGITYPNASFANPEVANAQKERIDQYLKEIQGQQ